MEIFETPGCVVHTHTHTHIIQTKDIRRVLNKCLFKYSKKIGGESHLDCGSHDSHA